MKFTHLFLAGVLAASAAGFASCGGSDKSNAADTDSLNMAEVSVLTVDQILSDPAKYEGDTVTVEGICSHLCKHGGTKAFLATPDSTAETSLLMCIATEAIGGAFDPSCPDKQLTVSGVLTPNVVTRSQVEAIAAKHAKEVADGHCDAEQRSGNSVLGMKAQLDSMAAANPADTTLTVGYYLETLSYALPQ